MDDQNNLGSQSLKERAWTTDEIRKHSSNWSLAGDVGLFNLLNEFSHHVISRTHEVENAVDSLVHQTKMTSAKVNNVINDFHMLSNLQFVENRVYDEEQESVSETKSVPEKTKDQREAEMLPKIVQAIQLGLSVLDTAFDRINVNEISDSEDEEDISSEGRIILEPKDPYEHRPLPYIIGSEEFMKCDFAGLKDLIEEDAQSISEESSISETDETSSDDGEPLPLDEDRFSEKQNDLSQNISDKISSSDESELFGSEKDINDYASQSSLEFKSKEKSIQRATSVEAQPEKETPQKPNRQSSVSSLQAKLKLPQVLPVPKLQAKKEVEKDEDDGDLFANEGHSDEESPFRKTTGLFASDIRFKDEKEDDLFGGDLFGKSPSEDVKKIKPAKVSKPASKQPPKSLLPDTKKPALFDNDEDSEDDIFNTLMKTKKPTATKTSNAGSQDSSEKADTSSTPSSAPSTKPSGNAFDFATGAGNVDSLFADDSDGDDLFSSKKTQGKKFDFDSSENDDLFGGFSTITPKETKVSEESLFVDKKAPDQSKKKETEKTSILRTKTESSIFEDSDGSDQEKVITIKPPSLVPVDSKKEINLFGDDDDLEEDIFSKVTKETKPSKPAGKSKPSSLFDDTKEAVKETKPSKSVEKSKPSSLFDDTKEPVSTESKPQKSVTKPKATSLFDDNEEEPLDILPTVPKGQKSKLPSLFDDSDNFDLFTPKPAVIKSEPKPIQPKVNVEVSKPTVDSPKLSPVMIKPSAEVSKPSAEVSKLSAVVSKPSAEVSKPSTGVSKPSMAVPKVIDEVDGAVTSKVSSPAKGTDADNQVSFDTPVDSSNVLNVINKSRVKVTSKRRKPTRQGRLAALENSDIGAKPESESHTPKPDLGALDNNSDSLFSGSEVKKTDVKPEPPKLDHKSQEKKKMNLMSQLMSEVATSKISLKKSAEKEEENEDEDFDIFSTASKKDKSKGSFSFKIKPEENGIASVFPIEKKEDKKDDLDVSKADSFEDDFFTEPAFKNFRSSISQKDPPVLDMADDDDDDDDDLFSAIKSNILPKAKAETSDSNDLFGEDETDIFADVQKEKYEMFPNQVYDDEDDVDIFSNISNSLNKSSSKSNNSSSVKKAETKQVNAFDDPLTGLLGED